MDNDNIKKCPHCDSCSQNLCPLDLDLPLRNGGTSDKCRWMRDPKQKTVNGRVFTAGGAVMPNGILNFVPGANLRWLNEASRRLWAEINKKASYAVALIELDNRPTNQNAALVAKGAEK